MTNIEDRGKIESMNNRNAEQETLSKTEQTLKIKIQEKPSFPPKKKR